MNIYYKKLSVWKRVDSEKSIRFNCFEILGQCKFCVQSVDYFYLPLNRADFQDLSEQFIELFIEEAPESRSDLYDSLEEAVESYENQLDC